MAADGGLSPLEMGMILVYTGSSQFIAVNMLSVGASPIAIIITTFLVNLRHLLFSVSLSPYFKDIKRRIIPFISFFITDKSFAGDVPNTVAKDCQFRYHEV